MANLLLTPEDFTLAGSWARPRSTVIADQAAAPDGTATADQVILDGTTNTHGVTQSATILTATQYTFSVFVKYIDWQWVALYPDAGPNNGYYFDIQSGVIGNPIGSPDSGLIEDYGNGWFRLSVTTTSTITSCSCALFFGNSTGDSLSFLGDSSSGFHAWGGYLNPGAEAEVYVSEAGNTVTAGRSLVGSIELTRRSFGARRTRGGLR